MLDNIARDYEKHETSERDIAFSDENISQMLIAVKEFEAFGYFVKRAVCVLN